MIKMVCDRCGEILDEDKAYGTLGLIMRSLGGEDLKLSDLCIKCFNSFGKWAFGTPKKVAKVETPEDIDKKEEKYFAKKKAQKGGAVKRWTKDDVSKLKIAYKHQGSIVDIAKELGRTEDAVKQRLIILRNANEL